MKITEFHQNYFFAENLDFSRQIIELFYNKNWALYSSKKNIEKNNELESIISAGREKEFLMPGQKHIIFPLVKDDKNFSDIHIAFKEMYAPPQFIEFYHEDGEEDTKFACHPLDSIVLGDKFTMIIDKRLYDESMKQYIFLENPCIEVEIKDALKAINQINSYRKIN